jgi:hypothetical protein
MGNGYIIDLDRVIFKDAGLNLSGRDDVLVSLSFDAFYNPATSRGIRITRSVAA